MNRPEILGLEVITPDGRGSILSIHSRRVIVHLNKIEHNQIMKGMKREALHYSYDYKDVEIIKGQYCFDDERVNIDYKNSPFSLSKEEEKVVEFFCHDYQVGIAADDEEAKKCLHPCEACFFREIEQEEKKVMAEVNSDCCGRCIKGIDKCIYEY